MEPWSVLLPSEEDLEAITESSVFLPIYIGLLLLTAAGVWATFVKAGQRGWTCVTPLYNLVVLLRIARMHPLWLAAFLLPVVNIVFAVFVTIRLARLFGQGTLFGLGLILFPFVFYPVLGFGSVRYQFPNAAKKGVDPRGDAPAPAQLQYRKAG